MKQESKPYYAVIFTSLLTGNDVQSYQTMAANMEELAKQQPGFIGIESARESLGITVSYWKSLAAIKQWRENVDHQMAQKLGREKWYQSYTIRIAKVEREYGFDANRT